MNQCTDCCCNSDNGPPPPPSPEGAQKQQQCIRGIIPLRAKCKLRDFNEETKCCGVTRAEREEDAEKKVNNRIFFMGITKYGYQKPIREAVNPALRDRNEGRPSLEQFLPDPNATEVDYGKLAENFHNIDVYTGLVDGRNYGRVGRLVRQKIKHARNPHGTEERFCVPLTNTMDYGWWIRDKTMLDCHMGKWYAVAERFPTVRGEITKFVDEMALHTPNFILF